jgi:hypothetical protein
MRIIRRAGLTPWPKLFHNLRASRETELAAEYPTHVVCAWIGNTERIAAKHYRQVTDDDFAQAQGGAESGAAAGRGLAHVVAGKARTPGIRGVLARRFGTLRFGASCQCTPKGTRNTFHNCHSSQHFRAVARWG